MTATGAGDRPAQPANATPSATIPKMRPRGSVEQLNLEHKRNALAQIDWPISV